MLLARRFIILGQAIALAGRLIGGIALLDLSQTHPNADLLAESLMVRPDDDMAVRVRNRPDAALPVLLEIVCRPGLASHQMRSQFQRRIGEQI